MSKLCVAGCSVSDYVHIKQTYGELLGNKLGYEYIHEGAGCGSNYRMWRKLSLYIKNEFLTDKDILIIQYTETTRNEFWSMFGDVKRNFEHKIADDSYDSGIIIRYKHQAYDWQPTIPERKFFKDYETYFLNIDFSFEQFDANNFMFQNMLKQQNIRAIFLKTTRIGPKHNHLIEPYLKYSFIDESNRIYENNLSEEDHCHFSQLGSNRLADKLYDHIKMLGWLDA